LKQKEMRVFLQQEGVAANLLIIRKKWAGLRFRGNERKTFIASKSFVG